MFLLLFTAFVLNKSSSYPFLTPPLSFSLPFSSSAHMACSKKNKDLLCIYNYKWHSSSSFSPLPITNGTDRSPLWHRAPGARAAGLCGTPCSWKVRALCGSGCRPATCLLGEGESVENMHSVLAHGTRVPPAHSLTASDSHAILRRAHRSAIGDPRKVICVLIAKQDGRPIFPGCHFRQRSCYQLSPLLGSSQRAMH
jgi:hypothetical protein